METRPGKAYNTCDGVYGDSSLLQAANEREEMIMGPPEEPVSPEFRKKGRVRRQAIAVGIVICIALALFLAVQAYRAHVISEAREAAEAAAEAIGDVIRQFMRSR